VDIGVKITGTMEVNGERVPLESPSSALRLDILNEVGTNDLYISKIDKIVLVDNTGAERDYTTSLTYTDSTGSRPPYVIIEATINITADYTVSKIRLYAGTKLYFETSWSKLVSSGDQVYVKATIQVSASGSLSGTTTAIEFQGFYAVDICKALIGASRNQIGFAYATLRSPAGAVLWAAGFSRSVDTTNYRVTGDTGVVAPGQEGTGVVLFFHNSSGTLMCRFDLASPLNVTANTRFRVTFTFTC